MAAAAGSGGIPVALRASSIPPAKKFQSSML